MCFIIKDNYVSRECTHLDVDFLKNGWRRSLTMPGSSPTSDSCGSAGELQIPRRQANRDNVLLESDHPGQLHQSHVISKVGGGVLRVYLLLLHFLFSAIIKLSCWIKSSKRVRILQFLL